MLRFLLGLIVALGGVAAGVYFGFGKSVLDDRCFGRCGTGTHCAYNVCIPNGDAPVVPEPKVGKKRGKGRPALSSDGASPAEPEKKLQPGDERMSTTGDALGRPEHLDLSQGGDEKELPQSEIDRVWGSAEPALSRCITEALGDWPLQTGKVEVSYRIEKDGSVKKVRISAPQLLMRNGLSTCVRGKVTALRFPHSGTASVVTFPFQLQ